MDAKNILHQIGDSLASSATVKSVFGEPIHTEGRTVVPVANVAYGFGGGFGSGHRNHQAENGGQEGEGGGGGGGVRAYPAGALEITPQGTRFIPFPDMRLVAGAFLAGLAAGALLFGRRRKQ